MANDPPRRVEEGTSEIPDPVVHSVNKLMDDMYFKDGSVRERLKGIEETLKHVPTKAYILGVILTVGVPTIIGIVAIAIRIFTQ